jgi:hypothetical protein
MADEFEEQVPPLTIPLMLPPALRPEDAMPVSQWIPEMPFDVAVWGDNEPRYADGRDTPREAGAIVAELAAP